MTDSENVAQWEAPPEIQIGDRVRVTAHDVAFGGEGVAKVHEFILFVPFLLQDESAVVEIVELKKRFGRAKIIEITKPSLNRVEPACRFFGECGGCQYQHLSYEAQLSIKRSQVAALLQRIGQFDPHVVEPVVGCPEPYAYRNRIMIRSQWDKTVGGLHIGFLKHESRLVVDIDQCAIAEPEVSAQIPQVRANPPNKGGIKIVLRKLPKDWIVPADSFFQNNFFALPSLINAVKRHLLNAGSKQLIDAYCGVGFFGISLAECVESFVGIEVDGPAIKAARANAERRGIHSCEFLAGRTEELLPKLLDRFAPHSTSILLDPPRTGCDTNALTCIADVQLHQIIYISCHPATLARDLRVLANRGYRLECVTPIDMFPQTQHVECVASLRFEGST